MTDDDRPCPHGDHLASQTEHERWKRELAAWRDEIPGLLQRARKQFDSVLAGHEEAIRGHEGAIDEHEIALALVERGGDVSDRPPASHLADPAVHDAARLMHAQLAQRVESLRRLVDALEGR
jgi:hypothetical protein